MRVGRVPLVALLFFFTSLTIQVRSEDLYWQGEEEPDNEYLEVKDDNQGIVGYLKRIKRETIDSLFGDSEPEKDNSLNDPQIDDDKTEDDEVDGERGSGLPPADPEPAEKTLRVTFVVMEPYREQYSNRDSTMFQTFSKALSEKVNMLFYELPGTQKASLVRIQSRPTEVFSCKVTLDITTTGYDNTDRISQMLRDHIRNRMVLGTVTVKDEDFSSAVIDPGYNVETVEAAQPTCPNDKIQCSDGTCVDGDSRCNGVLDCPDGQDESGCSEFDNVSQGRSEDVETPKAEAHSGTCENRISCGFSFLQSYCPDQKCDGIKDCLFGEDEQNCEEATTTLSPDPVEDDSDKTTASPTRQNEPDLTTTSTLLDCEEPIYCESSSKTICPQQKCDGVKDCPLGEDEESCTKDCQSDELQCDSTRCVSSSKRCDGNVDCYDGTDEADCADESCGADDFRCSDNRCIELTKRCNRVSDCPGGEDEENCECGDYEFKCSDDGSCIPASRKCDGTPHCLDGSDEADCVAWSGQHVCVGNGMFRCSDGTCISVHLRCDGVRDCRSDGSDEIGCPCLPDQWQCDHGYCIQRKKRCDGRIDCPSDRSDERHCFDPTFTCRSGEKISSSKHCDGKNDCSDNTDEQGCPCLKDDFRCDNGFCIPASKRCDRITNCQDGSDERDCSYGNVCMASEFTCTSGACVTADAICNGTVECQDSSDEVGCPCKRGDFRCRDGTCLNAANRCDGRKDCKIGEDEFNCFYDKPKCPSYSAKNFTCNPGSVNPCGVRCDLNTDCSGGEDEEGCQYEQARCPPELFTCKPGSRTECAERCNSISECDDAEDEDACDDDLDTCNHMCDERCLDDSLICNGDRDCSDGSDEVNCDKCDGPKVFRCSNGECLRDSLVCNGLADCDDGLDELNCNSTITPAPTFCNSDTQFTCHDGSCINDNFVCDGNSDCNDNSDEESCECAREQWKCRTGQCIPNSAVCNGLKDCSDWSDEESCYYTTAPTLRTTARPPYRPQQPYYTTTYRPVTSGSQSGVCGSNEFRCENGPCIPESLRCNGHVDCVLDESDELDCPSLPLDPPGGLLLRTRPDNQTARSGGDVVFRCRDEGPLRAAVQWIREGGRRLKPGSTDRNGRLEINEVSVSDGGVYICQAMRYLGQPGSQARVTLNVQAPDSVSKPAQGCSPYQATCANGQCISKSLICDGKPDCSDGSDEESCINASQGMCEPNQFRCKNNRCILKTWVCDSDNDCEDNSDETDCGPRNGEFCSQAEFACANRRQCIPKIFHCDNQVDCQDSSDEIGCAPIKIIQMPTPANLRLTIGSTLVLECQATGLPVPLISWRLNWRHVPPQCTFTSVDGKGVLTCPNMQPEHSGAYSCEAISKVGSEIAKVDSNVFVENIAAQCPPGKFNSEARSENECISCFCFGKSYDCRSADLFTYVMATPLGEGGTRLVGIKPFYDRDIQIDSQQITDQYYYSPLRNGATITKLKIMNYGSRRPTQSHPYLTLPETYNGNQLTSYGGRIKYLVAPHSARLGVDRSMPDIIIKGKYESLVYSYRGEKTRSVYVDARLVPENWEKPSSRGLVPASREDIMMALDNIEMILLRADQNNGGVNITEFAMQSARDLNTGQGAASLVEHCSCPPGYDGLSCQKCAAGYVREQSGPWLGNCVRQERQCPDGSYGDANRGCRPCPCPLTSLENRFARTCSLGPSGNVICDCLPGYEGSNCEVCAPGYVGNPLTPGDQCKKEVPNKCNSLGTAQVRLPDECSCKDHVEGRYCDRCKQDTFFLSEDFRQGCARCFCSGVTQQCSSSNLRRKTTTTYFNTPQIVNQVKVYNSAPSLGGRYNAPVETPLAPYLVGGQITLGASDRSRNTIYYWSLPANFAGDKVTSYGGFLQYTLRDVPSGIENNAADVQLVSDNKLTFHYFGNFQPDERGVINASIQFLEKGWQRPDGKEVQREQLLLALADVKTILIKATYTRSHELSSLVSASIDTSESYGNGPMALHVEECVCPVGYQGTSCEDCAPGYKRGASGLYLELCEPCECNGHSNMCDASTGVCYQCADNTDGESCETCKPGYEFDARGNCLPMRDEPQPPTCDCDPRGEAEPCDSSGYCRCKPNVDGATCDTCRPGTFGLHRNNPLGCLQCFCSGVTANCHEASHYARISLPAPMLGSDFGGYTIMDVNGEQVINSQFVPAPVESELTYVFSSPPDMELYWSLPGYSGNRILSYGGVLSLTQKYQNGGRGGVSEPGTDVILVGNQESVYWTNNRPIRPNEALSYQVPIREEGWFILRTATPASRQDFMNVLKNLERVLVRATLTRDSLVSTSIADVFMDTAYEGNDPNAEAATEVEVCICPEGYTGTSCESCKTGFYRDSRGYCTECPCNGHDCQLNSYSEVVCNCKPPFTGPDCSSSGLIMELRPTIHEKRDFPNETMVSFVCKYQSSARLNFKFYHEDIEIPSDYIAKPIHSREGWKGEAIFQVAWEPRRIGEMYECQAVTASGITLGVLSTSLPESGIPRTTTSRPRPPPPHSTVTVTISGPSIMIKEIGSTVNFTCKARSRLTQQPLQVTWIKKDGYLPRGRSQTDPNGMLLITNVQVSDSGTYVCQTTDGKSTDQKSATLTVAGNPLSQPTVNIVPPVSEYSEGETIVLKCEARGNPTPTISWQRSSGYPLPSTARSYNDELVIEDAKEEYSGEYRCIARNPAGSDDRTAVVTVRSRQPRPRPGKLTVSDIAPSIDEGKSMRIICTGTTTMPAGSISWIRQDGTDLQANIRSENGVLTIDTARMANQGVYICQAAQPNVVAIPVLVSIIPLSTPSPDDMPKVVVPVESIRIATGERGEVECIPQGYPQPLVKWTRRPENFGRGTSQRGNTLIINDAQESDQGYYTCEGWIDNNVVDYKYVAVEIERREKPRVEIWPQGEQSVTVGSNFQLHCRGVAGIPEPDIITWERDGGRSLSANAQIQPHNVLSFKNIQVHDEGDYSCTATTIAGTHTSTASIRVRSPPEITITPSMYETVAYGDPITITCRADGYPKPLISIRSMADRRELVQPSLGMAVLRIQSASERDDGEYACTASSLAGTIVENFAIRVNFDDDGSGERDINGVFTDNNSPKQPEDLIGFAGIEPISIICNTSDDSRVSWQRADRSLLQNNARQDGIALLIENPSKSDSGQYECLIIDPYTNGIQSSAVTNLVVVAPPKITLRPRSQTVQPGESPTVQCVVEGDDITEISWRPVNRAQSSRVEIRNQNNLIFHQIEVEDEGRYECFAKSAYGANASAVAEVIVRENNWQPEKSNENEQTALVGKTVELRCDIERQRGITRWRKGGKILRSPNGILTIPNVQKKDEGRYECTMRDSNNIKYTNYTNLHVLGVKCRDWQFRCQDGSGCIDEELRCDSFKDCQDGSDEDYCQYRNKRVTDPYPTIAGPRVIPEALVSIEQPRRKFKVGDDVNVLCRGSSRDVKLNWEKYPKQFVAQMPHRDGAQMSITGVQESDAGVYRCTGEDNYGQTYSEDFTLEVIPGLNYQDESKNQVVTTRLGERVILPCNHHLEQPVNIEWRREKSFLPANLTTNENYLEIPNVIEDDAGAYVCHASNYRDNAQTRVLLRILDVVPMFTGESYLSLPYIRDSFRKLDLKISFKPSDSNGLILYNGNSNEMPVDYIALSLVNGIPQFVLDTGSKAVIVNGDRPVQLNEWHTVQISRNGAKMTMDVDETGPFTQSLEEWDILDLKEPLYIGGVPQNVVLPNEIAGTKGFIGCVGQLMVSNKDVKILTQSIERQNLQECDSCSPNHCLNNGVCQDARNKRGYICLCPAGYRGANCNGTGTSACHPGICGPGKCTENHDGYKCSCPLPFTGTNCERQENIAYPAFTGSAYLALKSPSSSKFFKMSMKLMAMSPVTDGIIMYCAEFERYENGGFMDLIVHNRKLEFRYFVGDNSSIVILTSNNNLPSNEWVDVDIAISPSSVSMQVNKKAYVGQLTSQNRTISFKTDLYIGGIDDDSIILNHNTGATDGFRGCIKDVTVKNAVLNLVNMSIQSENVQECYINANRGDIPDTPICENAQCQNGGYCYSPDASACTCQPGYTGAQCEISQLSSPCDNQPCANSGTCTEDNYQNKLNYRCDCGLGYTGNNCERSLELLQSVGFDGSGYLELPSNLLRYELIEQEPVIIALAIHTIYDGVLLYQQESARSINDGDFLMLRVEYNLVVFEWNLGSGSTNITVDQVVTDGDRHQIIAYLFSDGKATLTVDSTSKSAISNGISNVMGADSNIYIGGIPESMNYRRFAGLYGCIEQVEMSTERGLKLGKVAVAARNAQQCVDLMFPDVYPFFEEIEVFESPPPRYRFNSSPRLIPSLSLCIIVSLIVCLHWDQPLI